MATVFAGPAFFRAELRVYGDWRDAFAREMLQNATDARPTRIEITCETVNGHGRVTFYDDGHGMTRRVLEEVFFALGETTKTGPDTIGGFGRARIITSFAQEAYTIRTGNLLVTGQGGEYSITEDSIDLPGTLFVIDTIDPDHHRLEWAFRDLLTTSSVRVPVRLNGERIHPAATPPRATRVLRTDDGRAWGRVYAEPGSGVLRVRVHGLVMFRRWLTSNDDIILELEPRVSREVLTASRDSLTGRYQTQFDQFVAALSQNRRKALRPPAEPLDVRVGGGGFMASAAPAAQDPAGATGEVAQTPAGIRSAGGTLVPVVPYNQAAFRQAQAVNGPRLFELRQEVPAPTVPLGFDVYLYADANDARVRRLARLWDPSQWDSSTGSRRRQLLLAWRAAVGYALEVFLTANPQVGRVLWTVGWTFDEDTRAVHRNVGEGHVLALSPVTGSGTTAYRVSSRQDRRALLAVAAHEVVHIVCPNHDEQFASLLTDLVGQLDQAEADRLIRDAVR